MFNVNSAIVNLGCNKKLLDWMQHKLESRIHIPVVKLRILTYVKYHVLLRHIDIPKE